MKKQKYSYTEVGLLAGMVLGGGIGAFLFANTGYVMFLGLIGVGAGLGLGIGAAADVYFNPTLQR